VRNGPDGNPFRGCRGGAIRVVGQPNSPVEPRRLAYDRRMGSTGTRTGARKRSTGAQVAVSVLAVVIALMVGVGVSATVIGLDVQGAQANAKKAKSSADIGNMTGLIESVKALQSDVQGLAAYTASPAWFITKNIPAIGQPVKTASTLTSSANQLSESATGFVALAEQLDQAQSGTSAQFIPTEVLNGLGPASQQLAAGMQTFTDDMAGIEISAIFGPLQARAQDALDRANELLPELTLLVRTMPSVAVLLGSQGPQTWFVALQNGGESRGTGGLVGSFSVIEMDQGKAIPKRVGPNNELTAKANPAVVPEDSRQLWGPARLAEIYGVNLSPHYPYASELLSSMWQTQSGTKPDAVLALDQRATVELIKATGGFTVDGVAVTATNAYQLLTVDVYAMFDDAGKDAFVTKVVQQLMQKITSGAVSPIKLASVLADSVLQRSIFLWAQDAQIQQRIAPSPISGEVPTTDGPFAMAVVNNNAANKMDTFLYTSVNYAAGECIAGGRRATLSVELFNNPPSQLPDTVGGRGDRAELWGLSREGDGSNRVRVAVYLPKGAFLAGSTPQQLFTGTEREHPVAMFGVEMNKGERKTVTVDFTQFGDAALVNQKPNVLAQPMLNPQEITVQQGPTC